MKEKILTIFSAICAGAALCFAPAAFAEEAAEDLRPVIGVDAKFIENKTSNPHQNFTALVDRLTHALTELGIYQVINAKDLEELLKNNDIEWVLYDEIGEPNKPLRRSCYMRFVVTSYGWQTTHSHDRMTGTNVSQVVAELEAILFLVDSKTGKMLKSVNLEPVRVGRALVTGTNQRTTANLGETALQDAARTLVANAVREIIRFTKFAVLDVDAQTGEIMIEPTAGITKVGDLFKVLRPGKKIRTKRGFVQKTKDVGIIQVTEVGEDYCTAVLIQTYEENAKVKNGDMIQFVAPTPQKPAPPAGPRPGQPW